MSDVIVLAILIATIAALAAAVFYLLSRKSKSDAGQSEALRDLERRLTDLLMSHFKELRSSQQYNSKEMHRQIYAFAKETTQIREGLKQVEGLMKNVSAFQDLFRAPKLRGQWGEASLEHILSQHFPRELYETQLLFSSGEQVDAALKLPNGKILPIDAKFPSENFIKMAEAPAEEKEFFQKKFVEDVKMRINEIASKYILPSEGTVDVALMYIPAEAIYYEIVNNIGREVDLVQYGWSKKVIITSPNTIYLHLRVVEHWFRDTQVARHTREILKRIGRVRQDAAKLLDDFRKLGSHLRNAMSSYDTSEKRLSLFSDRVERLLESKEAKKLAPSEKEDGSD